MKHTTTVSSAAQETSVRIRAGGAVLEGDLALPAQARGLVLFAHGSGSSRHSGRNREVARQLQAHGLGTLLFDLLTEGEERVDSATAEFRFDIDFLASRLIDVTHWTMQRVEEFSSRIGYFGSSTGAAAALKAAAEGGLDIAAVVSRGGRADLANDALRHVRAPTLLIVGSEDHPVLGLNRLALERLTCEKRLEIVPGATHLFEEPGALDTVARMAGDWFAQHLSSNGGLHP